MRTAVDRCIVQERGVCGQDIPLSAHMQVDESEHAGSGVQEDRVVKN